MKEASVRVKASETELKDKLVSLNRVAKVTKGGRTFSFAAIVVVGDGQGTVGQGLGKARDVSEAIAKAVEKKKKNLVKVPVHKGTIRMLKRKFGACRVYSNGVRRPCVIAGGAMGHPKAQYTQFIGKIMGSHPIICQRTINALTFEKSATVAEERKCCHFSDYTGTTSEVPNTIIISQVRITHVKSHRQAAEQKLQSRHWAW